MNELLINTQRGDIMKTVIGGAIVFGIANNKFEKAVNNIDMKIRRQ